MLQLFIFLVWITSIYPVLLLIPGALLLALIVFTLKKPGKAALIVWLLLATAAAAIYGQIRLDAAEVDRRTEANLTQTDVMSPVSFMWDWFRQANGLQSSFGSAESALSLPLPAALQEKWTESLNGILSKALEPIPANDPKAASLNGVCMGLMAQNHYARVLHGVDDAELFPRAAAQTMEGDRERARDKIATRWGAPSAYIKALREERIPSPSPGATRCLTILAAGPAGRS